MLILGDNLISMSNLHLHHRRSIRLKGYDYSREGLYFKDKLSINEHFQP